MINRNAPFPQANDFNKIISIINVDSYEMLKDTDAMSVYLGDISSRQVDYYESACAYLGILTRDKEFTEIGKKLRNLNGVIQIAALSQIVISDEIFGNVYFRQKMLGIDIEQDDIIDIIKEFVEFESPAMYVRRASTVASWVNWIIEKEEC